MKQRITVDQLLELSEDQRIRLREWWYPTPGEYYWSGVEKRCTCISINFNESYRPKKELPLLTIGQMIELLDGPHMTCTFLGWQVDCGKCTYVRDELADALWEGVKESLLFIAPTE
jgi:hypothetical protein